MGAMVFLGLVVALLMLWIVLQPDNVAHVASPAKWCESHNGSYYISRSILGHGGPHCELANGTTVHLR